MKTTSFRLMALAASMMAAGIASANVTFYDLFKTVDYWQDSTSQPTTASDYRGAARIFTDTAGDATSGTLTYPDSSTSSMTANGSFLIGYSPAPFSSQAALDAAFPTGTYGYSIHSGTLAGQTGSLDVPNADFPDAVPYLTGTSYTDLQNMNTKDAVTLNWNTFGHSGGANTELTFFTIYDLTAGGAIVFTNGGDAGSYTSQTIDANTLTPFHNYEFSLVYSSRFEQANQGFNGATSTAGFDYNTSGTFHAVPEPTSMSVLGFGLLGLLAKRRCKS